MSTIADTKKRNRRYIEQTIKDLKELGMSIALNKDASGYRITTADQGRDVSPRLQGDEMYIWLSGFVSMRNELGKGWPFLDRERSVRALKDEVLSLHDTNTIGSGKLANLKSLANRI